MSNIHKLRFVVEIEMTPGQLSDYARYNIQTGNTGVRAVKADIKSWMENLFQSSEMLGVESGASSSVTVR